MKKFYASAIYLIRANLPHTVCRSLHMEHEISFLQKTSLLVHFGWWTPPLARFWHLTLVGKVSVL